MIVISLYNHVYLFLLLVLIQLIDSAPEAIDELSINLNIGGKGPDPIICGVKKKGTRSKVGIVNGTETEVNEYPWMAKILAKYRDPSDGLIKYFNHCGGSVVADKWILTAAHCIRGFTPFKPSEYLVILGEHDVTDDTESPITKRLIPVELFNHPEADYCDNKEGYGCKNDIALIKIPRIDLRIYTPICLPVPGADYTGKTAWVYGWGNIVHQVGGVINSDILLDVEVPVFSDAEGSKLYADNEMPLTDEQLAMMIFAGEVGRDSCTGDSGGPLSFANPDNNGRHEQIGIVSWGVGCPYFPGVYTEVSAFTSFIHDVMAHN